MSELGRRLHLPELRVQSPPDGRRRADRGSGHDRVVRGSVTHCGPAVLTGLLRRQPAPDCRPLCIDNRNGLGAAAPDPLADLDGQGQYQCQPNAFQPLRAGERGGEKSGLQTSQLGCKDDHRDRANEIDKPVGSAR